MSDIICVTNRLLCREDLIGRLQRLAEAGPKAIILREKDLAPAAYSALAKQALTVCGEFGVPCILHGFADIAAELGAEALMKLEVENMLLVVINDCRGHDYYEMLAEK